MFHEVRIKFVYVLVIIFTVCFTGCKGVTNVKYKKVDVDVISADYIPEITTCLYDGETYIPITISASYNVTVSYKGVKYNMTDSSTYKKYKDKVGTTVSGMLEEKWFDDGTVRYKITKLN